MSSFPGKTSWKPAVLGEFERAGYAGLTFPAYQERLVLTRWRARTLAVGLAHEGKPVALALVDVESPAQGRLLSLFVEKAHRRRGLATAVLQKAREVFEQRAATPAPAAWRWQAIYRSSLPGCQAFEAFLASQGWSPPTLRMLVLEATYEGMLRAPFMQNPPPLEPEYRLVPWETVTEAELRALGDETPFSVEVWPLNYREPYHRPSSLGVRLRGQLVGWIINHPRQPPLLRFTTSYLREDLQRRGRFAAVMAASVRRTQGTEYHRAIWTVPLEFPRMINFARRRLAPFCETVSETRGAVLEWKGE